MIADKLSPFGAQGYDANSYMQGKQYYFGFTLGAAYRLIDQPKQKLSVYGGMRVLYGSASYKAKISDIMVKTANGMVPFGTFLDATIIPYVSENLPKINAGLAQLEPVKDVPGYKEQYDKLSQNKEKLEQLNALGVYREGVNLQSDQSDFGFAPIVGVDYQIGNFNFAAKYDFRVKMAMENESTVKEAHAIPAVNKFRDGTSVREDAPALLAVGAQWAIIPSLRVNAAYHYFFDKESKKYQDEQEKLKGGTNEYLGGIEYDVIDKLTVSGGFQITRYGLSDEFMNDMSFVTDSWSFGFGLKYQVSDRVAINAAYFKTCYDHYKTETPEISNDFTRTNRVAGVGVELTF